MLGANWDITDERMRELQLQQAIDELTQFAYRASHDLKSPITSTLGLLSLIREDLLDGDIEQAQHCLSEAESSLARLCVLIEDVINLSRADVAPTAFEMVDLQEICSDIIKVEKQVRHGIDVTCEFASDAQCIVSSKIRIQQIMTNLITNAFKFSDSSKPSSYVHIRTFSMKGGCKITISDNGLGIPVGHHDEVFEMFTRVHPGAASGSGLGLAIVKKHIDHLNGSIGLESSSDGTTFSLFIPDRSNS